MVANRVILVVILSFQNWVILFYKLITRSDREKLTSDSESASKNTLENKTKKNWETLLKVFLGFPLYSDFSLHFEN